MEYEAVIGLETHVQLKTRSKMWCGCPNEFGAPPNTLVCPVCLGMPGVLPVANEEALRLTVLTGLLLQCEIPAHAKFDRKNYFYPDVAKNYQITQYDQPSTRNGVVEFETGGRIERVRITRAHLEEDVAKNFHFGRESGVDFNRAGVPLLEIVSEPDLRSAEDAYAYLNALTEILVQGGVSDCDMEKGMVRCDVNVSVRPRGSTELGAKIEIKNMNSFSGVRRALEYEIPRQIAALGRGERLRQETRRWDDDTGMTEPMRTKEHAHDYRYMPDPDLLPFEPSDAWIQEVRARVVELPLVRKQRVMREYGLTPDQADVFRSDPAAANYFESCVRHESHRDWVRKIDPSSADEARSRLYRQIANTVIQHWRPRADGVWADFKVTPDATVALSGCFVAGQIGSSGFAKAVEILWNTGRSDVAAIISEHGLAQVSDTAAIEKLCDEAIAANPGPAEDYRKGKAAALNFLKGQVMKLSKGKANAALAGEILERKLKG